MTKERAVGRLFNALVIVLLALALWTAPVAEAACDTAGQLEALQQWYNTTGGQSWHLKNGWVTSSSAPCTQNLTDLDGRVVSSISLPSYCCWHGVQCCLLATDNSTVLECAASQCNCTVGLVSIMALSGNNLLGSLDASISSTFTQSFGCSLRRLQLSINFLYGNVPDSLGELAVLEQLQLGINGELAVHLH